ncbi:MAG TPA: hypothetical protein H9824_05785 [Candidatus Bacteroides pullicola]|uniref:Lipoprotein n=1 Tax=Candidatus Bacteroides pullicola TaxID=2838475 RepID=A0A9D1ZI44_9BACE|nr:hypothetical protein [Candidatus Bacteroides pullicola]
MKTGSIFLLYLLALFCLLCGCRQMQYVPVVTILHDSIYLTQMHRDSILRYDSIYVRDAGDTVWLEKYKYVYRDRWRTDTLVSVRTDTVGVPVPVERELTRWERVKMEAGGYAIVAGCAVVLVVVGYMVYRIRKK